MVSDTWLIENKKTRKLIKNNVRGSIANYRILIAGWVCYLVW